MSEQVEKKEEIKKEEEAPKVPLQNSFDTVFGVLTRDEYFKVFGTIKTQVERMSQLTTGFVEFNINAEAFKLGIKTLRKKEADYLSSILKTDSKEEDLVAKKKLEDLTLLFCLASMGGVQFPTCFEDTYKSYEEFMDQEGVKSKLADIQGIEQDTVIWILELIDNVRFAEHFFRETYLRNFVLPPSV